MQNVMVDLETLGINNHAVIIALGAVMFDPVEQTIGPAFYSVIDPQSCVDAGLKMDVSTVMWWMTQSDEARKAVTKPGAPLGDILFQFSNWFPAGSAVWGNGATFDNVILANAYIAVGLPVPWAHWNDRCYRTLKNLYPSISAPTRMGTAHNALDDAVFQATHANALLREVLK